MLTQLITDGKVELDDRIESLLPFSLSPTNFNNDKITIKDTTDIFPYLVRYPKNIQQIKHFQLEPDFKEKEHYYIDILKGAKNGQKVFIVDENNNKDFTDDSIKTI